MKIEYHRQFKKNYRKRIACSNSLERRFKERFSLFLKDPSNPILADHTLRGVRGNLRAFSITGDIRLVYSVQDETVVLFDIGTHNQVY